MIVLAGDIGGTRARFQFLDTDTPQTSAARHYRSADFSSFIELLRAFLAESGLKKVDVACFGLPGPVTNAEVTLTNLPWHISAYEVSAQLPITAVHLLNDFQAAALGVDVLSRDEVVCLYAGDYDAGGNRLVVGAGTGLGVAPVYQLAGQFYPQSSEGGHMVFAPVNNQQKDLLAWLNDCWPYVSYEHLLSGTGLETLYQFCSQPYCTLVPSTVSAANVHALAEQGDASAVAALTLFVNIYGQFIGDIALLWPARAGIYIAGGIGAKIVPWMQSAAFTDFFLKKDIMCGVVEKMPVYLVTDELMGLKGALLMAKRMAHL